ncbi:MAG: hypothetical protein WD894_07775 [Pirellulales bacterium]
MNADEFIRFAGLLVARFPSDEAALRTAVSRAYYGAYHLAIDLLSRVCGERFDHGSVRRLLKESGNPIAQNAGRQLDDLQSDRIKADYRLDALITLPFARINIERGVEVQRLLTSLTDADALNDFAAGLDLYLKRLTSRQE